MADSITIRGARQHNLKNITLTIPKNKLVVFTGLSGSGKSSLAFDTLYAEGQRRYVESLSSYARQFLGVMDKPDVDAIEGLSPAISIDQKTSSHNPRSTVGTITEIYDYLRLLFARVGHPHCPTCGREIAKQAPSQITDKTLELLGSRLQKPGKKPVRVMVLSPVVRDRKGEFSQLFIGLKAKGYTKIRIDGRIYSLNDDIVLIKTNKHTIDVIIDRVNVDHSMIKKEEERVVLRRRLALAIEQATALSEGLVIISEVTDPSFSFPEEPKHMTDHLYSLRFSCAVCNISLPEIEPRMFSFNSPHGACPSCDGIGVILRVDPNLVLNRNLTIKEGGILPFARMILGDTWFGRILLTAVSQIGINASRPLKEIDEEKLHKLLFGTGDTQYEVSGENRQGNIVSIFEKFRGVVPEMERRFRETESEYVRMEIGKYMKDETCAACLGKRLKKDALSITIITKSIADITGLSIRESLEWIQNLNSHLSEREKIIARLILREINERLSFLVSVGLDYLTLSRSARSLSGGETQRIRLASQIGSGLSGVLYVLDEPSVGLHQRDNNRLIKTLKALRDLGNTLVVVEHDRDMMEHCDLLVDIGPGAGAHGGKIIFCGSFSEIKKDPSSLTGKFLSGKRIIDLKPKALPGVSPREEKTLSLTDCSEHNLKALNFTIPLYKLNCITGVSGSGKSTLVVDTLYEALSKHFNPFYREHVGAFSTMNGHEHIRRVILIDQSPIGRTPRSNPVTYTGAFTFIRELFSNLADSRARGYGPGRFSFNVRGGRCEACEGEGVTKIEMQFLPDVYVTCDVCAGTRFNPETLEIRFKGKNIAEVLEMTVEEAFSFFENIPGLYSKLATLNSVGLSYIHLGQPAPQLSGGEAQRVKLSSELSKRGSRDTLYILDEPTTGLHFADLEKLLKVLRELVDIGNTVVVIEHNLDVIKNADWIIDLGPEGGDRGGEIIVQGTPREVAANGASYTGQYLKKVLQ